MGNYIMNDIEKSIIEQSIALLNNSFNSEEKPVANNLIKDAISRLEGLLERKD